MKDSQLLRLEPGRWHGGAAFPCQNHMTFCLFLGSFSARCWLLREYIYIIFNESS